MAPKLVFLLFAVSWILPYCSAFCKEGLPCIYPDKSHYQLTDQWVNLKCATWSAGFRVMFLIENGNNKLVMFDSNLDGLIPDQFRDKVKLNAAQNGISYSVANNLAGTPRIYCQVDDKLSPPIQLNCMTIPILTASSTAFLPEVDLTLKCGFRLAPRNNFLLSVNYYVGDKLLASIRQGEGDFGSAGSNNFYIPDNVVGLKTSYVPNKDLSITVKQVGQFENSEFYCTVTNIYVVGNDYQSKSVKVEASKEIGSSSSAGRLSLFYTAVSIVFILIQFL